MKDKSKASSTSSGLDSIEDIAKRLEQSVRNRNAQWQRVVEAEQVEKEQRALYRDAEAEVLRLKQALDAAVAK